MVRVWRFPQLGIALGMKSVMGKGREEGGVRDRDWSSPLGSKGERWVAFLWSSALPWEY